MFKVCCTCNNVQSFVLVNTEIWLETLSISKTQITHMQLTIYIIYSYTIGITRRSHINSKDVEFYFRNNITMNKLNPKTMENALTRLQDAQSARKPMFAVLEQLRTLPFVSDDVTKF